eukprot:757481-Hanusia_phi.AAC.5
MENNFWSDSLSAITHETSLGLDQRMHLELALGLTKGKRLKLSCAGNRYFPSVQVLELPSVVAHMHVLDHLQVILQGCQPHGGFAKCIRKSLTALMGRTVFITSQVTFDLQGGVVWDPCQELSKLPFDPILSPVLHTPFLSFSVITLLSPFILSPPMSVKNGLAQISTKNFLVSLP